MVLEEESTSITAKKSFNIFPAELKNDVTYSTTDSKVERLNFQQSINESFGDDDRENATESTPQAAIERLESFEKELQNDTTYSSSESEDKLQIDENSKDKSSGVDKEDGKESATPAANKSLFTLKAREFVNKFFEELQNFCGNIYLTTDSKAELSNSLQSINESFNDDDSENVKESTPQAAIERLESFEEELQNDTTYSSSESEDKLLIDENSKDESSGDDEEDGKESATPSANENSFTFKASKFMNRFFADLQNVMHLTTYYQAEQPNSLQSINESFGDDNSENAKESTPQAAIERLESFEAELQNDTTYSSSESEDKLLIDENSEDESSGDDEEDGKESATPAANENSFTFKAIKFMNRFFADLQNVIHLTTDFKAELPNSLQSINESFGDDDSENVKRSTPQAAIERLESFEAELKNDTTYSNSESEDKLLIDENSKDKPSGVDKEDGNESTSSTVDEQLFTYKAELQNYTTSSDSEDKLVIDEKDTDESSGDDEKDWQKSTTPAAKEDLFTSTAELQNYITSSDSEGKLVIDESSSDDIEDGKESRYPSADEHLESFEAELKNDTTYSNSESEDKLLIDENSKVESSGNDKVEGNESTSPTVDEQLFTFKAELQNYTTNSDSEDKLVIDEKATDKSSGDDKVEGNESTSPTVDEQLFTFKAELQNYTTSSDSEDKLVIDEKSTDESSADDEEDGKESTFSVEDEHLECFEAELKNDITESNSESEREQMNSQQSTNESFFEVDEWEKTSLLLSLKEMIIKQAAVEKELRNIEEIVSKLRNHEEQIEDLQRKSNILIVEIDLLEKKI